MFLVLFLGLSQVQYLTADVVAMLIPKVIPKSWYEEQVVAYEASSLSPDWLPLLWKHLRTHHPSSLSKFTGLPILPITASPLRLIQLTEASCAVMQSALGATLSAGVERTLGAVGAHVVVELPQFVRDHAAVVGIYVKVPVAEDVVEVLYNACKLKGVKQMISIFHNEVTQSDKSDLLELISRLQPKCIDKRYISFLSHLPVFQCFGTIGDAAKSVSVAEIKRAATAQQLSLQTSEKYLDASSETAAKAARLLGATFVNVTTMLKEVLTAELKLGSSANPAKVEVVALDLFQNFTIYCQEDPSFPASLSSLPFVKTVQNRLECPSKLFDPESKELQHILAGADVFPGNAYALPENLQHLRKMGLKSEKNIMAVDLLNSMMRIERAVLKKDLEISMQKSSIAILSFLNRNPTLLWQEIGGKLLVERASQISWVASLAEKPAVFPSTVEMFAGETFYPPRSLRSSEWLPVIGAVRPIVAIRCESKVAQAFGWDAMPDLDSIVAQLHYIVGCYRSQEKAQFLTMIMAVYEFLSRFDASKLCKALRSADVQKWIWHGDGFASVDEVLVLPCGINLQPYMFSLPSELQAYAGFFESCGVVEKCTVLILIQILHKIKAVHEGNTDPGKKSIQDITLAINILNQIEKDGIEPNALNRLEILIPCKAEEEAGVRLLPVDECTYFDMDWVRKGFSLMDFDESDGIVFIHPQLPISTAESLHVPTLMSRMLNAEELEINSFGQSEPLTSRLRKLLEDYSDGLAIPKELIQNADDAGASEIKFLYDERQNQDAMKYLIDDGMKACQGPALWAYNNATFTDKDFDNITRLGGATKQTELDKIGKFGLGFNAVYNITDVPSFVTRNTIVIFDPHTVHLGRGIRDRGKPGIKIDLGKNRTLIRKLPDQFKPYQDVFGCRIGDDRDDDFSGTLFRFPLRTREQAARSEISGLHYDRKQITALLNMLVHSASYLLLFTQSVQQLSFYHLPNDGNPLELRKVLTVEKSPVKVVRELESFPGDSVLRKQVQKSNASRQLVSSCGGMLRASSDYMAQLRAGSKKLPVPRSSVIIKMSVSLGEDSAEFVDESPVMAETFWFVSSAFGQGRSLQIALKSGQGFLPVGGVACRMEPREGGFVPKSLDAGKSKNGRAFCFLPIPVTTLLPVHVNGFFALQSDRRCLSFVTEDDKANIRVEWNRWLLEDAVTAAYIQLLQDVSSVLPPDFESDLYEIWPSSTVDSYFLPLVESFYRSAVVPSKNLPLLYSAGLPVHFEDVVILENSMANSGLFQLVAADILSGGLQQRKKVGVMPEVVLKTFSKFGLNESIGSKIFSVERFYRDIFFPSIANVTSTVRDSLVLFALGQNSTSLDCLIREQRCIPASPDGQKLCRPRELIHPSSSVSLLFEAGDGRFPHGDGFCSPTVLSCMERLGMQSNHIGWEDLLERCCAQQAFFQANVAKGKARFERLMVFLDRMLLRDRKSLHEDGKSEAFHQDEACEAFMEIHFLIPLAKPDNFPLKWVGEQVAGQLLCPSDVFTFENRYLVSATSYIVDDAQLSYRVRDFLRLVGKKAKIEQVVAQMEHAFSTDIASLSVQQYEQLQNIVYAIYGFLQDHCAKNHEIAEQVCLILKNRQCILLSGAFLYTHQVALNFSYSCAPYLYGLPADFVKRFHALLKMLGVREHFEIKDYMTVLQDLKQKNEDAVLNAKDLDLSVLMATQLNNAMKLKTMRATDIEAEHGTVFIPNVRGVLKPASSLCYNDCPWITETSSMNFAHPQITFHTSACLGVRTKCQEALRQHARGIPFGQRERLTNSLKRILHSYPFDREILKELIQNADDAGATVMHFIKDGRHHPTNHVFDQQWKPLQGPALCVYNNSPFTDNDLAGIQQLGEGSKSLDFSKTGQYGIGFSSVYHLTDAPSLLTTAVDGSKKLCVFDPHCRYVPGATLTEPGMQFENVDDLRDAFPDVFRCYLEEQFSAKGSTIFRLPLRTKEMADSSEISTATVSMSKVQAILDQLREELFEILLFTNHLEEIIISDVDPGTGSLVNSYTVKALLSKEDRRTRHRVGETVQDSTAALKSGKESVQTIKLEEAMSTVVMTDSTGNQEKWLVVQRLGFEETVVLPDDLQVALQNGDLALLPRGGVACLMERRQHGRIEPSNRPSRVFCFLPLPVETDLPVHINGHFALGYENRRHLWTNTENAGYKREWNDLLCSRVIAPAYVMLLKALRMMGLNGALEDDVAQVSCSQLILEAALKAYLAFFPTFSETKPQWNILAKATYQFVAENKVAVLPSVCEADVSQPSQNVGPRANNEAQHFVVTWLPPNGEGSAKAFFRKNEKPVGTADQKSNQASFLGKVKSWFGKPWTAKEKSDEDILKDVLLECGVKLIEASEEIFDNFKRSDVEVHYMTPDGILLFFSSYSSDNPMCNIGKLPQLLSNTPFQNEKTLLLVLDYCKRAFDFREKLADLPLLLTADDMLRRFSSDSPVLYSKFSSLLPACSDKFLKPSMLETAFSEDLLEESEVFKKFQISDLAEMLPSKLPQDKFKSGSEKVEWVKSYSSVPTDKWLQTLWSYISFQLEETLTDIVSSSQDKAVLVTKELAPLRDWCILPARSSSGSTLFSLGNADLIVDFGSREYQTLGMRSVIQKCKLPQLDITAVNSDHCNNLDVVQLLVTTLDKPDKVVNLLQRHFSDTAVAATLLSKEDCSHILKYLCEQIEAIGTDKFAAEKIRSLPIFCTIFGDIIRLTNCLVYTLPAKIPTNGVDIWQSKSGTVFLERNDKAQVIYDFLGCATISVIDVYCQFIFQHFEYFVLEDRLVHLHHIYTQYLQDSPTAPGISEEERNGLLASLRSLPFLEDESGELQCASHFYDPENVVFRIMEPAGRFAPKAQKMFKESEWYSFLAMLGMIRDVTSSMFLDFTKVVATEGRDPNSASALMKSKVLVQHLYTLPDGLRDPILSDIVDVPFVAPEAASPPLQELYAQHGDLGAGKLAYVSFRDAVSKTHEKLCWTCANLLPSWADPVNQSSLSVSQKEQIVQHLAVQKVPNVKLVLKHLETLCQNFGPSLPSTPVNRTSKMEVYRAIYKYLIEQGDALSEIKEKLEKIPCVLVDDAKACVLPRQTVLNIYDTEEIRPYLYKLPVELGEYQRLFISIGTTNRATAAQYVVVMELLNADVGKSRLTPNELRTAYRAVRGLLETLENAPASEFPTSCLYLPSEKGKLVEATRLVFNDAPSFYDRVKEYNLQFLFDVRECGLRLRSIDEIINLLPPKMRPAMLSTYVQEMLVPSARRTVSSKGIAKSLSERLKSERFLQAVVRLVRHEAHKKGQKLEEHIMFSVLDRLSTISVYTVPNVMTHLSFKGKPIAGSEMEKVCFVERLPGANTDLHIWNIYMRDDMSFSQELLIPLAEVVNSILSGMLHDSVLYLLPVLSCPEEQIQTKLDHLNIRLDHSSHVAARAPTMPLAGSPVDEEIQPFCSWGQLEFLPGEYIAYRNDPADLFVYGVVREELMSPNDDRVYLLDLGKGQDGIIASVSSLYKFMRR